ncbi:hypothetical protein D9M70_527310 [compost metagenome]
MKFPSSCACPTVAEYCPYSIPITTENSRLLPEPSIIECISTAVSIFAPVCCSGYASQRASQSQAPSWWLHRNEISQRRFSHAASLRTGCSGSPSNVLMYTLGSCRMHGSNTM